MNRIAEAITAMEDNISELNGVGVDGTPLSELDTDLRFDEFVAFQNAQSRAFATGKVGMDEAQLLYRSLGGEMHHDGDGWPTDTSLATKIVVTKVCAELMGL